MKANELTIGDWVYSTFYDKPCKVVGVEQYESGCSNVKVTNVSGAKDINSLTPIPLTPEILEKNGFKKCEGNEFLFYKEEEERALYQVLWSAKELYLEIDSYTSRTGEFNRMGVEFVHQLQHALRLCGIEKTIEL